MPNLYMCDHIAEKVVSNKSCISYKRIFFRGSPGIPISLTESEHGPQVAFITTRYKLL